MRPLLSAFMLLALTGSLAARSPNIVVIIADDLGYGECSCQTPTTDIPTPNIDAISRAGVRFTDGYVTAPFCAASRAGLLTGRLQTRFGFEFNPIGDRNAAAGIGLPVKERTLADQLRDEAGYATTLIGKWHLGGTAPFHPVRRGFDHFFGFLHEGHFFVPSPATDHVTWLRRRHLPTAATGSRWTSADGRTVYSSHLGHNEPAYDADNPIIRDGQPVIETENLTDAFAREAVSFIEGNADRPFLLCLSFNAVHSPLQGRDDYLARFASIDDVQRRIFAAMLSHLDDAVGRVTAALRRTNIEEDTLLFFISDNGGPTAELTSSNLPLRAGKGSLYEGGIRVPFLLQWPRMITGGQTYEQPVSSLDIAATALAATGVAALPESQSDGVNLMPFLTGQQAGQPHQELFWRVGQQAALRSGEWKIVRDTRRSPRPRDEWELYRLADDIGETRDLASTEPDRLRQLRGRWETINAEMVDPLWR